MRCFVFIVIMFLHTLDLSYASSKELLLQLLQIDPDYNVHLPPHGIKSHGVQNPAKVGFQINLRNVLEVDEVSQIITLEITLRMFWRDERIRIRQALSSNKFLTFHPSAAQYFWIPDIFIDRAKELRYPTFYARPASLRVYNDSLLRYAARVNFDVACKMSFQWYPADTQVCEVKFESFGFTSKQLEFSWMNGGNNINANISLPQFDLSVDIGDDYATDYYDLDYPGVIIRLVFKRKIYFHLIQTYVPSCLFVILAWLAIFIHPEQVAARVTMTMTTLLTLTAMFGAVRANVPRVSYVSMLDIWMVTCMAFIFSIVINFIAVNSLLVHKRRCFARFLDLSGLLTVPLLFLAFNLVYWHLILSS